jgi:hypothetical protein
MIQQNINLNENESKTLRLIAKKLKTKDLTKYMPLCLSAIEKRIAKSKNN